MNPSTGYQALSTAVGVARLQRTQIEIQGADRVTFLHNMCTNDIKRLQDGDGCEAFITNVQGKILGHVFVFATQHALWLDTVAEQAETLINHLDRYIIREAVELHDRSSSHGELLLAGPAAGELAMSLLNTDAVPAQAMSVRGVPFGETVVQIRRVDWTSPEDVFLSGGQQVCDEIFARCSQQGVAAVDHATVEAARIEHGTPLFGIDIGNTNLPQEVNRNPRAISFTKGCYLGQETVARIDALGHVNWLLRGLQFPGDARPDAGSTLDIDGKKVATITSSAFSPQLGATLALAYVRNGYHEAGTTLPAAATVVEFPS